MVVELVLVFVSSLWLMQPSAAAPPMAKPGCNASCGDVTIPYPFGFGEEHCYHEKGFEINCKVSANNTAKPFLIPFDLEVLSISLDNQNVTVNVPVVPICRGNPRTSANLTGSPFRFSDYNIFRVRGCGNALLTNQSGQIVGGCTTTCNSNIATDGCYGIDCCEISIPSGLAMYSITTTDTNTEECTSSFLWYPDYYPIPAGKFSNIPSNPVLLDWMITSLDNLPPGRSYRGQRCSVQSFVDGMTTYSCQCPPFNGGGTLIFPTDVKFFQHVGCIGSCEANYSSSYIGNGRYDQYYCYKEKKSLKAVIIDLMALGSFHQDQLWFRIERARLKGNPGNQVPRCIKKLMYYFLDTIYENLVGYVLLSSLVQLKTIFDLTFQFPSCFYAALQLINLAGSHHLIDKMPLEVK